MKNEKLVWVRGAGELGSAIALILHSVGYPVILSELSRPLAIRRTVTFTDAIFRRTTAVEGVSADFVSIDDYALVLENSRIPIVVDNIKIKNMISPDIIVDARMLKKQISTFINDAEISIGLGPEISAGISCNAVIETKRGHTLGKIIWQGMAEANTGIPGEIGGESKRRLVIAPRDGRVEWKVKFGDIVQSGDLLGKIYKMAVNAPLSGIVRGLIAPQTKITSGMKIGDIDPRGAKVNCMEISDKARCVARGVLEAILICQNSNLTKSELD